MWQNFKFIFFIIYFVLLCSNLDANTELWVKEMFRTEKNVTSLLPEFSDGYGVAFRDLDGDGDSDLYVVRFRNLNRLFIYQKETGAFNDMTIKTGLGGNLYPRYQENLELSASIVDYDNDGFQDVFIGGWGVTTKLFRQAKRLKFVDVTEQIKIEIPISGNNGIWADVDIDGDLDLYLTNEHGENKLYIQSPDRTFTEKSREFGVNNSEISQSASFADVDLDGYPDLYVCNWESPDVFYRNIDGTHFKRINLPLIHLTKKLNSNGVQFGDIDNDGDLDLLVTDRQGNSRIYLNECVSGGEWKFNDWNIESGINNRFPSYSGLIADFDNDGWQDIFFSNIGPNLFFRNQQDGLFKQIYQENINPKSRLEYYSTGAAVADIEGDGDLDLFVANKDTSCFLFLNPGTEHQSIRLLLEGVHSNRDAIGAKVWLYSDESENNQNVLIGYREVSGGGGYLSISEPIVHFGISEDKKYKALVQFPSGIKVRVLNLVPGDFQTVSEISGLYRSFILGKREIVRKLTSPAFWLILCLIFVMASTLFIFLNLAFKRYEWSNYQILGFILGGLVIGFLVFGLVENRSGEIILIVMTVAEIMVIGIFLGFLETIYRAKIHRFQYRNDLKDFSQQVIFIRDKQELYGKLVRTIKMTLEVDHVGLYEMDGTHITRKENVGTQNTIPEKINLKKKTNILQTDESNLDETLMALIPELNKSFTILPLSRKEKTTSFLLIGEKQNKKLILKEDLDLLTIVANQSGLSLENINYIEESKKLASRIAESETRNLYISELEEKTKIQEDLLNQLKSTQAQLIQSEKMSSLGQLVAGIAHELNNPISFIYANMKEMENYIEILTKNEKVDEKEFRYIQEDVRNLITESMEGSNRVKAIVENLRNFSRIDEGEFSLTDIHKGIDSAVLLLKKEASDRIQIHKKYGKIPEILCMSGNLNQVFMNILLNGIQSIKGKGNIWIKSELKGSRISIVIKDDGIGMEKQELKKIFDPFYTTKPVGEGTGLGLSISYGIIENHGGSITVESKIDSGTAFTINIPIDNGKSDEE